MSAESTYYPEYEESKIDLGVYWAALKRRRYLFIIPASLVFLAAIMLALGLPASYRSTATILIEEQEIPRDLVRSTITSFAAQQIQVITQRVMTMENIIGLVEKFKLYGFGGSMSGLPKNQVVDNFRNDVTLDLVSADVIDPRSGKATEATIAFSLSFDSPNPETAKQVANALVNLYLEENLRSRSIKAAGASEFLMAEADSLNQELVAIESKIAQFKQVNEGALPELYQFNLNIVERTERDLSDVNLRLQELEKRQIEISAELAQQNPSLGVMLPGGEQLLSDEDRLMALRSEYRKKSAVYHDSHPDLVRMRREIETLEASITVPESRSEIAADIALQKEELNQLQQSYKPDHPRVLNAKRVISELEEKLAQAGRQNPRTESDAVPDNPAYVMLQSQGRSNDAEIQRLLAKKLKLEANISKHEDLIRRAPTVEKEYQALLRNYQTAQVKYQEIKAKQREADVSKNLEQGRKGERFTLIEPPALPTSPYSPNRPAIIFLGLVLAAGFGFGLVVLFESMDASVRGERAVTSILGAAPLVVIPYLVNEQDRELSRRERKWILLTVCAVVVLGLVFAHLFYKPFDTIWLDMMNNSEM